MSFILFSFFFINIYCYRYNRRKNSPRNGKPQFDVGDWWTDTNGSFIQAHGGNIEHIDNYNCFNNGTKGCWVWCGEDSTHEPGTYGAHCYASTNLYAWEDKGIALYPHNLMPEKLNGLGNKIIHNLDNLKELKRRANLPKNGKMRNKTPRIYSNTYNNDEVTDDDIDIARNFLRPYVTEMDKDGNFVSFDESNLITGFTNLYQTYCVVSRPKFLYNRKYNNYVLLFHADGPLDSDVIKWINDGMPSYFGYGIYNRAMIGFAVSNNPFGPYKLVNVQRMHHVDGWYSEDYGQARDMGTYVDYNEEDSEDIAYVLYSSENNKYLYISRLDDTYTTWSRVQGEAKDGYEFKARVLGESTNREAPAIFRHKGYYYLMTSGTTYWDPNTAIYYRSTMLYGPYEEMGNPCQGSGSERTFDSQSTYFIRYNSKKGQFIYMGDRWWSNDLPESRYVLLPCEIDDSNHKLTLHYTEHWSLEDVFGPESNFDN